MKKKLGNICQFCKNVEGECNASVNDNSSGNTSRDSRDMLLDLLLERVHDTSAYCRSRCLKAWITLCEENAIPRSKLLGVVLASSERLADKSAFVRKNALAFLETVFKYCPFQEDEIAAGKYTEKLQDAKALLEGICFNGCCLLVPILFLYDFYLLFLDIYTKFYRRNGSGVQTDKG